MSSIIFREGDPLERVYFIHTGEVKLVKKLPSELPSVIDQNFESYYLPKVVHMKYFPELTGQENGLRSDATYQHLVL